MDDLDRRVTRWLEDEAHGEPPAGIVEAVATRIRAPLGRPRPSRAATSRASMSFLVASAAAVIIVAVLGSVLPANVPDQTPGLGIAGASPSGAARTEATPTGPPPTSTATPTPTATPAPHTTRDPNLPTPPRPVHPDVAVPTPGPPSTPPPPPFTPSGAPVASVLERGVRVEMWLSAGEVSHGDMLWGLIRVSNEADRVIHHAPGCAEAVRVIADYSAIFPRGERWTGLEAEAKRFLLDSVSLDRDPLREPFQRADLFERDVDCNVSGVSGGVDRLGPGDVIDHWIGWLVSFERVLELPSGRLVVTASFPHLGSGVRPDHAAEPVMLEAAVSVLGPERDYLGPGELVDAFLGSADIRAWLRAAPNSRWIDPDWSVGEDLARVGIFRRGPGTDRAFATVDIHSGELLDRYLGETSSVEDAPYDSGQGRR